MSAKAKTRSTPARSRSPRPTAPQSVAKAAPVQVPAVKPMSVVGTTGVAEYGGYVTSRETNAALIGAAKWKSFANLVANIGIVAAGVRRVMGLVGTVEWKYEAANETPQAVEIAEMTTAIMSDTARPWRRIVKKIGMAAYNGASLASWQAKRRPDGKVGYARIDDRPLHTIERWILDDHGDVRAVVQRDPKTGREIVIPRGQLVYVVDDLLTNGPEGLGLLRHCVEPANALNAFKKLEGIGFETDLRGVPYFKAPLASLAEDARTAGAATADQINAYIDAHTAPLTDMMDGHIRGADTGILLDSAVYANADRSLSNVHKWGLELLRGDGTAQVPIAAAIKARMWEIAIILNVEGMLVGDGGEGSLAMDKSKQLGLLKFVQGMIDDLVEAVQKDLVERLMWLNGWPLELMPIVKTEQIEMRDIAAISAALRDLATAGIVLDPNSELVYEFMSLMGFTWTGSSVADELDAAGRREPGEDDEPEVGEDPLAMDDAVDEVAPEPEKPVRKQKRRR